MEIEKKYLVDILPFNLSDYSFDTIEQGYISKCPVIRIRQKTNKYYLTCKSKGLMAREEFEIEITEKEYKTLFKKTEGFIVSKLRYYIPIHDGLTVELDLFSGALNGLVVAEVEFTSLEQAEGFIPPPWLKKEVTLDVRYHNSYLCQLNHIDGLK